MYYLANEIVAIIGFEELLVCILGVCSAMFLWLLKCTKSRFYGFFRWTAFAPFGLSCYLVLRVWQVHEQTLQLLQDSGSLSEAQANLFWSDMYSMIARGMGVGVFASLALYVCFCRNTQSTSSPKSDGKEDRPHQELAGAREKEHSKPV